MSKSTDKTLASIKGVSRVAGLRTNGTLMTEGVSGDPSKELDQPGATGGAIVNGNSAGVDANRAAQNATSPAPHNQTSGPVTGDEGKVPYDAAVAAVSAGATEVPTMTSNKAQSLPAMPQQPLPESAPKTKSGLINAIYEALLTLDVKDLADVFSKGVAPLAHRQPGVGLIGSEPQKNIEDARTTASPQFPGAPAANAAAASKLSGKPTPASAESVPTSEPPTDKLGGAEGSSAGTDAVREPDAPNAAAEQAPDEDEEKKAAEQSKKVAEAMNTLIAAEKNLSEGFKNGAAAIVEAHIQERVALHVSRLEENYGTRLTEETAKVYATLAEKTDSYLNYVVQNWMEENKVAIERGLRTEIAEGFIEGLKGLFKENYIEVPEGKENLVEELNSEIGKLEAQLQKQTESNIKLNESVSALQRKQVLDEACRGLAATDAAKLTSLTKDVDFENSDSFIKKVGLIRESFFHKTPAKTDSTQSLQTVVLNENQVVDAATGEASTEGMSDSMARYSSAITRTVKADASSK